ncbi:hypothetical protein [uncultured Mediterranean phage uvMED]|nr:hypothetical protein [uncultured Mediterranean phage uvMED]
MKKEVIEIDIETGKAQANLNDVSEKLDGVADSIEKVGKESKEGIEKIADSSKQTAKGVKGIAKAFKTVGTAIKAAGIGLIVAGLAQLKEIFEQNQKVADLFSTTFEVLSIAFNDFANFITSNTDKFTGFFKDIFDNPLQSVKDLGNAIRDNIIERFNSLLDTLGFVGDALSKFIDGDFDGAAESIKAAGKELVDVYTGVDGSFDKIVEKTGKLSEAVSNYTSKVVESAKQNVELNKQAELGAAKQAELVEQFDQQAEKLRQIRDNDLLTIQEREEANNKLLEVLKKQKEAMLEEADAQLRAAEAQFKKNKNQENEIALIEARTNKKGVEAQIEGFLSEQEANRVALQKESLDLTNSQAEADGARNIAEMEANAALIENDVARLERQKEIAEAEKLLQEEVLKAKRDSYVEGTQAFQDANNELLDFQQDNAARQKEIDRDLAQAKVAAVMGGLSGIASLVGENSKFGKAVAITQAVIDTYAGANKALAQGGIFGAIGAAGIIATGIANVKKITSTEEPSTPSFASSGGGSVAVPQIQTPDFNIVGQSSTNQLAEAIGSQTQQPIKAFVVSSDVSTAQELDRNIIESASI